MTCEKVFLGQLRERGFRLTPQRQMVLNVLHQVEGTATAEEIHSRVQSISSCVDISTIYRTLGLLREFSLVASIDVGDGQRRYALLGVHGPRFHLACQSCGKLIGVEMAEARSLVDHLRRAHGFEANLAEITIPGLCQDCGQAHQDAGGEKGSAAQSR